MSSSTDIAADTGKKLVALSLDNYDTWAPRMEHHLAKNGLWGTIEYIISV
jgi:hypothetical protein